MKIYLIIGLVLALVGVLILGYFGLPMQFLDREVEWFSGESQGEKRNKRIWKRGSWTGLVLTCLGFLLQLIATVGP